ncbi:MAG TPA: class F sortase [Ornithinimicrobium sp.]|uniref:class F sortase n=1 Tax=Ornithinimicrobium sp. TaxID=1977084 RepID=UPI002B4A4F17|nr:class F sortase [Ornithinimicrobium sp.]HKJ12036.1 class F sortase [Ornithinimicrobium sp.]
MQQRGWLAVLVSSLASMLLAGVGIAWAGQPTDVGTIDVGSQRPDAEQVALQAVTPAGTEEAKKAGPALTAPDIARRSAEVSSSRQTRSTPTALRVPSVDLDAPLTPTGVRRDGLMRIPDDGDRVGWYRYGAAPGAGRGSVVLAGHVDTDEGWGAMAALREVERGALVEVELNDGRTATYEVVGRKTVSKNVLPTDTIFDRDGPERLTLITCGGPWRTSQQSYRDNVVVVATPVGSP